MKKHNGLVIEASIILCTIFALSSCYKIAPIADSDGGGTAEGELDPDGDMDINWVWIEGGPFEMGSDIRASNEHDVHTVTVQDFEMMKAEVTVIEFVECVNAGACDEEGWVSYPDEDDCNFGGSGRDDHPMNCVNWHGASAFCAWAGGRLPTEAEWEYAARSRGKHQEYPWGDDAATCDFTVMSGDEGHGCGIGTTWKGCSKPKGNTEEGLCDMVGNVWEWVQDDWHDNYTGAPTDGSAWMTGEANRVVRGGSWSYSHQDKLRARGRDWFVATGRYYDFGFRCARSIR